MTQPPPPVIPVIPFDQTLPAKLTDFLRRLSLWSVGQFDARLPNAQAWPSFFLLSPGGKVYQVTVDDSGALHTALVTPGAGRP